MQVQTDPRIEVPSTLIDAIRSFPLQREVEHCGGKFAVSPFQMYVFCPHCNTQIKLRSFSAIPEIEDVFDAVFEWISRPGAGELARKRQQEIEADRDE
jgi:hypothetical protein